MTVLGLFHVYSHLSGSRTEKMIVNLISPHSFLIRLRQGISVMPFDDFIVENCKIVCIEKIGRKIITTRTGDFNKISRIVHFEDQDREDSFLFFLKSLRTPDNPHVVNATFNREILFLRQIFPFGYDIWDSNGKMISIS